MTECSQGRFGDSWKYRIIVIAAVNVVWSLVAVRTSSGTFPYDLSSYGLVIGASMLLLMPVFYYALSRDTGAIQESDVGWNPDRRLWVGGGILVSLIGVVTYLNPFTHYVAAVYLFQRYRKAGSATTLND